MLKIAVVTAHFPSSAQPTHGKPAYETLRVLSGNSDVRVFYPHAVYPSLLKPKSRIYDAFDASYSLPGVKASYYDYPVLPLVSRPFNGWMVARVLLPHVRSFAPDLIFSYFLYPDGYAALKIGKELGVPVVAMGVGSDVHNIRDRFSAMHTRTVLREADFLVAISGDLRKRMIAMGAPPEKTRAVVSGCDVSAFRPADRLEARQKLGIDPAAKAVVYIGRMDVRKGLRELVEAAVSLHPLRPDLHVYMVGEGSDRPVIEDAIQTSNAASYIHALPECAFDGVAVWMAAADLVTLPSYMEGCPNVVLEALACGRPVVATNVGGIPEILSNECGCLVPPREPAMLAEALASVLDRAWDAKAISAHGGRSWEMVAGEVFEIFESIIAARQKATT
ncbi:MAG TPA: glycosyltransferase [Terracidiphilus sp.]|jgi:glycosyltransferase involved in cell wall biosynthesis|nr:glycosyltransferase [Terracidiphilus sp.]